MTSTVGIPPWYFYFYKVRSRTTYIFSFTGFSYLPILNSMRLVVTFVCMLYWCFPFDFFVPTFVEGAPKSPEELDGDFHATWSGCSVLIFLEVSDIFASGLFLQLHCPCRVIMVLFFSLCSLLKGARKFLERMLRNYERCTNKYSTYLLVLLYLE